jgi:hypothetical protein
MCPEILKLIFLICSARELMRFNRGKLELKNQKPKYQITAPTGKLAEL